MRLHCRPRSIEPRRAAWRGVAAACLIGAGAAACHSDTEVVAGDPNAPECLERSTTALYEQRIAPLLQADQPKSCNQCHLSGIDLGSFVRATPCETLACLVEDGLVDLGAPENSLVLSWIERATPTSPLITQAVIDEEYAGFREWIEHYALCRERDCRGVTCERSDHEPFCAVSAEPAEALAPSQDSGGCDDLTLELLFRDTVYASRGRCYPCHFASQENAAPGAARWIEEAGSCEQSSLATMRNVLARGFVDAEAPDRSLLITKPLGESQGGVPHGGHEKFYLDGDPGYANFLFWVERQAACLRAAAP